MNAYELNKYCEDQGYVMKNNVCLFYNGYLSQWYGGFPGHSEGGFIIASRAIPFGGIKAQEFLDNLNKEIKFNCCEQWMMACKALVFDDLESFDLIMNTTHPKDQKKLGRGIKNYDDDIWDDEKESIVYAGNFLKFESNDKLMAFLLAFNPHTIFAEASPHDKIWGIGMVASDPDALDISLWKGTNLLGEAIREVRRTLD